VNQSPDQASFRFGFSCTGHFQVIHKVIAKQQSLIKRFNLTFLHYTKAFDSVEQKFVVRALKDQGDQDKAVRLITNIQNNKYVKIPI
jgi:hypothetical protein